MSKNQTALNQDRLQFWQMVVETWQSSGLSVSKFCKAEVLSEGSFYNRRKKLSAAIFGRNLQFFYPGASKNAANPFSETQAYFLGTCSKFHLLEVPARWRCSSPSG